MTLEESKEILKDYYTDRGLEWQKGKYLDYMSYINKSKHIILDGDFTIDQLEAIVVFMRSSI